MLVLIKTLRPPPWTTVAKVTYNITQNAAKTRANMYLIMQSCMAVSNTVKCLTICYTIQLSLINIHVAWCNHWQAFIMPNYTVRLSVNAQLIKNFTNALVNFLMGQFINSLLTIFHIMIYFY